jgi:hypothetical protein
LMNWIVLLKPITKVWVIINKVENCSLLPFTRVGTNTAHREPL